MKRNRLAPFLLTVEDGGDGGGAAKGDKPDDGKTITMTSQQLADRLARAKPADYDDLKAKAARLDEIEQANKSEIEKANEAKAKAEADAATARAEALRLRVAAKHGISDEDADLFLTGTDEATLTKQAERLSERVADRKKRGNVAPKEGGSADKVDGTNDLREFTRNLFGSADD
ncbi:MAG TPA: hypothetical protein VFL73_10585 [Solirubrobacteraceae bacterium]|nr:hypothetical protein [Solirubrobacteraceae bacterium]